jgi:leader peptidase (prepilin peptidase) / N-methyltransferase
MIWAVGSAALGSALGALSGVLGGAALPTAAYRLSVPWRGAGEAPVPARDTCGHCGEPLPSGVPGWVRLGSRCPHCRGRLGPPGWLLATVTGIVGAGLGWRFGLSPPLLPYLLVAVLGVLIATVDLTSQRIPDPLVLPAIVGTVLVFAGLAGLTGAWGAFGRTLAGAVALAAAYLVLAVLPGAQLGGGDVALAGLLGLYLGWVGWPAVVAGALLPWLLQLPVAMGLLLSGRAGARTMLPLGPAMLAGAYLAVVGLPVLAVLLRP